MNSCFYEGQVRHRRFTPKPHAFNYRIFYVYLDLDELDTVFGKRWFWSTKNPALASFRREDHLGDASLSLKDAVADTVEQQTGVRPQGPIRLLTHLRYFGFVFNPVSFYYCFDTTGTKVETIVAEVNNTPWGEQHIYVLPQSRNTGSGSHARYALDKAFHVSPFMPMDIHYNWALSEPEQKLSVHMENYHANIKIFDATLALNKKPVNAQNCAGVLLRYPLMTLTVITAIYWQALKLLFKGTPVYDHPDKLDQGGADSAKT
jgi:uncharacterized protein